MRAFRKINNEYKELSFDQTIIVNEIQHSPQIIELWNDEDLAEINIYKLFQSIKDPNCTNPFIKFEGGKLYEILPIDEVATTEKPLADYRKEEIANVISNVKFIISKLTEEEDLAVTLIKAREAEKFLQELPVNIDRRDYPYLSMFASEMEDKERIDFVKKWHSQTNDVFVAVANVKSFEYKVIEMMKTAKTHEEIANASNLIKTFGI